MNVELDLTYVPDSSHTLAVKRFKAGDSCGFVQLAPRRCGLELVAANVAPLLWRGIYEEALLNAYVSCNETHFGTPVSSLKNLFDLANPDKLRQAGDPLPDGETFTLYRGVSGERTYRRVRSYSWTLSFDRACWFASRLKLPAPNVYAATVPRQKVLAYYNGRREQEIVCRPDRCRRVSMTLDEIFKGFNRTHDALMEEYRIQQASLRDELQSVLASLPNELRGPAGTPKGEPLRRAFAT